MKKHKLLLTIIVAIIVFLAVGLTMYFWQFNDKTINSFYDINSGRVNKIDIKCGGTGEIVTVDDKKVINDICEYLAKLKFKRFDAEPKMGWSYWYIFLENDKKVFDITFASDKSCIFNNNGITYSINQSVLAETDRLYEEAVEAAKR